MLNTYTAFIIIFILFTFSFFFCFFQSKIKSLRQLYKKARDKLAKSGESTDVKGICPFFDDIDRFMGDRPITSPHYKVSSIETKDQTNKSNKYHSNLSSSALSSSAMIHSCVLHVCQTVLVWIRYKIQNFESIWIFWQKICLTCLIRKLIYWDLGKWFWQVVTNMTHW